MTMSDDIVHDLLVGCVCPTIGEGSCRCCRAADEIVRLRAELKESEEYATDLWRQRHRGDWNN